MRLGFKGMAVAAVALALPTVAAGQFFDDFESYAPGTVMDNVGGWAGWANNPADAGTITTAQAFSGENSIQVGGGAGGDAVHPLSGITSGQWTIVAQSYIPRSMSTDTYFIVMNEYDHVGNWTWAIEMQFDITTGTVLDDFRPETPIPIAFDRWAEIRIEVDLDADTQTTFYDGSLLSTGTWTRSAGDPLEIANIDLFTIGTVTYYDDVGVIPAPAGGVLMLLGAVGMTRRRRG